MSDEDKYNVTLSIAGGPPMPASEIDGPEWVIPAKAFTDSEPVDDEDEFVDVVFQEVTVKVDVNGECRPYDRRGNEIPVSTVGGEWDMTLYRILQ